MQSAVFYPLDLALFMFPQEWFFGLSLFLHLFVAALGAFWLARICGAGSFPAAIAAIAYGLNGFTMIHIPAGNHLTYAGAAWVPWMFGSVAGFVLTRHSKLPWALATATRSWRCTFVRPSADDVLLLVFSFLFCLVLGICVERRREQPDRWLPPCGRSMDLFTLFGIGPGGDAVVPRLAIPGRGEPAMSLDLAMATEFSFAPHRLITLFCPEYYGTFIAGNHYDSFVLVMRVRGGSCRCWRRRVRGAKRLPAVIPLMIVGGLGLLLAWGGAIRCTRPYSNCRIRPFRAPAKFLPYYLVPVCVLARWRWVDQRAGL